MVSTHWVIHRQTLASKTLPQILRLTLDSAIRIVNYIKSSALNSRLFTLLCEDLDPDHKVPLFHTEVRWLSKSNTLARLYELKEEDEFLGMKADSSMKDDFHLLTLEQFCFKRFPVNSATYLCETGFSALVLIKTIQRNRLDVDSHLMIALAKTEPRINQLVQNMQSEVSH
ncbi:unnamed protein product [Acanthoscelides obtectus]|uniref:Uncharacterized protein n=1 Tax=Acanthoscelides obtectus TaxID=200917 RepID=A0A9P0PZE8_ACAOB|nr:unnamed protein product [Acanthoscelides obtectus]CAK1655704.1 SCAN domain-containing protein 3 [Acanthoscelides obtectus]